MLDLPFVDAFPGQVPGGLPGTTDLNPFEGEGELEDVAALVPILGEECDALHDGLCHWSASRTSELTQGPEADERGARGGNGLAYPALRTDHAVIIHPRFPVVSGQ